MMATNWRQISFQTVAKIAPETKRYALATLQLQFSSVPAARSSEHAAEFLRAPAILPQSL